MIQPPVIVTFANQKGGVGKTILCVTFANYLVAKGVRVVVINCDKAVLTGKKAEQKFHITHSKYIGGLKKVQYSKLMAENSDLAMTYAIKGMIPSNTIGAKALTRLHCYQGAEHAHAAQKPEKIEF